MSPNLISRILAAFDIGGLVRWIGLSIVFTAGCSAAVHPYSAALLREGYAETMVSAGLGEARRAYVLGPSVGLSGRYGAGPVELAASGAAEGGNTTVSAEVRWGALQSELAITPSAGIEAVFARASEWIPSVGLAIGTGRQSPVDASVTVRAGWRDLRLPEVMVTPAVAFSVAWFSMTIGGDVIWEPTVQGLRFRPYVAFGGRFETPMAPRTPPPESE